MNEKELKCINSLLASVGLVAIVDQVKQKYHCNIVNNYGIFCCGLVTSDLMKVRLYLTNKIKRLAGI